MPGNGRRVRLVIVIDQLDRSPEHAALGVGLLHPDLHRQQRRLADRRQAAGQRHAEADGDRRLRPCRRTQQADQRARQDQHDPHSGSLPLVACGRILAGISPTVAWPSFPVVVPDPLRHSRTGQDGVTAGRSRLAGRTPKRDLKRDLGVVRPLGGYPRGEHTAQEENLAQRQIQQCCHESANTIRPKQRWSGSAERKPQGAELDRRQITAQKPEGRLVSRHRHAGYSRANSRDHDCCAHHLITRNPSVMGQRYATPDCHHAQVFYGRQAQYDRAASDRRVVSGGSCQPRFPSAPTDVRRALIWY